MVDMTVVDMTRILLAILVGGLIGIEREYRDKAAGFRPLLPLATIISVKTRPDKQGFYHRCHRAIGRRQQDNSQASFPVNN